MEDRQIKIAMIVNKSVELLGANDIMILGQVKGWSFGEVTQEVLDDAPETKLEIIMEEINNLADLPLAKSGVRK